MEKICPYFGKCGGCSYQDLSDADYETMKRDFIEKSFARLNLPNTIDEFIRIPTGTRRRACFAFHKGHLGFNARKSHQIIDLDTCMMLTPALNGLIPALRKLSYDLRGTGDIFILDTPWGVDIHIKMGKEIPNLEQLELLAQFGNENNVVRLLFNNMPILEKVKLPFPPDVFLQPSVIGEKTLVDLVTSQVNGTEKVLDLFCGTGTFAKPLLEKGCTVTGYDSETASVQALGTNGIVRDLFRNPLLPSELNGVDVAVIDPPRAGAKAQIEQLAQSTVSKIIMISCDPVTAARDARILIDAGYTYEFITAVDQFTYSKHVEIAITFIKK